MSQTAGKSHGDGSAERMPGQAERTHAGAPVAANPPLEGAPINVELFASLLGSDDRSYMQKMLEIFWKSVADTPTELAGLVSAHDAASLRDVAHAAKGAASSAGAEPLTGLLAQLQDAAAQRNWTEIDRLMPLVDAAFAKLEDFIKGRN